MFENLVEWQNIETSVLIDDMFEKYGWITTSSRMRVLWKNARKNWSMTKSSNISV